MWVIIAIAVLAALVLFVLLVPLEADLRLDIYGRPKFSVRLVWLFGLVSREVSGTGQKTEKKPEEKPEKGKSRPGDILNILRTRGLLKQVIRLVKDIFRLPRLKDFLADLRVGLDDPADTGLLFAWLGPASALLNARFPNRVRLQPAFTGEAALEGFLYGKVRMRPVQLAPPVLRFAGSLAVIRAAGELVSRRWKRKKKR